MANTEHFVSVTSIERCIFLLRGHRVILSGDLAVFYDVEARVLAQAVKRNLARFPDDFMFVLSADEWQNLKSQNVISSWGGVRSAPMAFTEQGVACFPVFYAVTAQYRLISRLCGHLSK